MIIISSQAESARVYARYNSVQKYEKKTIHYPKHVAK